MIIPADKIAGNRRPYLLKNACWPNSPNYLPKKQKNAQNTEEEV
jgi:hypothetical protein